MDNTWELSKENIQPRKEGRDIKKLVDGLTPCKEQTVQRRMEMQEFELAIITNDNDDELDIWHRYIIWTEQNHPVESTLQLEHILVRCICHFHKNEKYKEDRRFVWIFLKYAEILTDPSDVFDYMFAQGIGLSHASFYESWATLLEGHSNYKRADEVYGIGIARSAQPLANLERQYQQFLRRFAVKVKQDADEIELDTKSQRESFAPLKQTSRGKVSHDRVKGKSVKNKGGISAKNAVSQLQGGQFTIFEEENSTSTRLPPAATGEWMAPPVNSILVKENIQKPGKWTSAKMPRTKASHASGPMFSIHEDTQSTTTSNQIPQQVVLRERKPLSSKKMPKEETRSMQNILKPKEELQCICRYRKHEVYQGSYEFSFEELRALNPKYNIGDVTDYIPREMEETCITQPASNTEGAVPKESHSQMCIDPGPREKHDIETDVGTFACAQLSLEHFPGGVKPSIARQRLCFSNDQMDTDKEEMAVIAVAPSLKDVAPSLKDVAPSLKDVAPSLKDVAPSLKAVAPSLKDVAPSLKDVAPSLKAVAPSLKDVALSLKDVAPSQGQTFGIKNSSNPKEMHSTQYAPNSEVSIENNEATGLDLNCDLRANQKPYDDGTVNMLESWDITEIEGINSKANGYFGPSQSTGVHDLVTVAGRTLVKGDSVSGTVEEQRDDHMLTEDEVLNGGDFSAILAKDDVRPRKIDYQPVSPCQPRQNLCSLPAFTKTVESSDISAYECAPTNDFQKPGDTDRHVANLPHIEGLSSFAIVENKATSLTENSSKSALVNKERQKLDSKENDKFSIYEDDGDIVESNNVRRGSFECTDSRKSCSKNTEFSIFEDVHATAGVEQPFLKPRDKSPPSHLKRQPCKDLTPFAEHKQARVDYPRREPPPNTHVEGTRGVRLDPIWMPSPTVHTKKAKQDILAMFSMPLECEKNEFSINFTEDITRGIDQQVSEQGEVVAPERTAAKPIEVFEVYDEEKEGKLSDGGTIKKQQSFREERYHSTLAKMAHEDSEQYSLSALNNCSSTHDRITASTFCNSAARPVFSAEIGALECTNPGEPTEFIDYQKNDLSPIEELSGEGRSSPHVTTTGPHFNGGGMCSISRYHSTLDGGRRCSRDELSPCTSAKEQIMPSASEMSVCDDQRCCEKCPEHNKTANVVEHSLADLSMQLSCLQVEMASATLATEPISNGSIIQPRPVNPTKEIAQMMTAMDFESFPTLRIDRENELQQKFAARSKVTLGDDHFVIHKKIAAGGFSVVYLSSSVDDSGEDRVALKVMKSPETCQWEFHIGEEIHRRIDESGYDPLIHQSFVRQLSGYVYSNGAVMQYPFFSGGTLLDLVNISVSQNGYLQESFALLYGLNICRIIKTLHSMSIIHGDVKPDNFLLKPLNHELMSTGGVHDCLVLTDFGKSIDLNWFSESITFTGKNNTDKFECIEMQTDRPWKYQTDYYGIACTLHVAYHGTYMDCVQRDGAYRPRMAFRRPEREFWLSVFDRLINVSDCNDSSVLDGIITDLQSKLAEPTRRLEVQEILSFHSHVASSKN